MPFKILVCGLSEKMQEAFKFSFPDYMKWNIEWKRESIVHLRDSFLQPIYLTADSSEDIVEISPNCTLILGGIVDRNRHKVKNPFTTV